jgi:hypothetical protein
MALACRAGLIANCSKRSRRQYNGGIHAGGKAKATHFGAEAERDPVFGG